MYNLVYPPCRDTYIFRQLILADTHGFKKFLKQYLAWMYWRVFFHFHNFFSSLQDKKLSKIRSTL